MCGSMVDIQFATAKIRREKKRKKERKKQDKNIMSESATLGGHNKRQEENLYGLPYYIGRP